jgi:hypothetical protein
MIGGIVPRWALPGPRRVPESPNLGPEDRPTMAAIDPAALRNEITTDPTGLGLRALVAAAEGGSAVGPTRDADVAAALNLLRAGIQVKRSDVTPAEIFGAVDVGDYAALPASPSVAQLSSERRYLAWLSGLAAVPAIRLLNDDGTDGPAIVNLKAMFGAGTGTRTRLSALATRNGSRAEQIWGAPATVSVSDVSLALRGR